MTSNDETSVIKNIQIWKVRHIEFQNYGLRFVIRFVISDQRFKDVRLLCLNIDRALISRYDLHEQFMQLILKFGQYLQHSLFMT